MTAAAAPTQTRSAWRISLLAFSALLLRDLAVLRKNLPDFLLRTLMQPLLFVFVFTYVFPKIGQSIGSPGQAQTSFASLLVPGVVALACLLQGIQSVALPLVQELGASREIEDRLMAPLPLWAVALEKLVAGALQALLAAAAVFPAASLLPATPVQLSIHWPELLTLLPLAALLGAAVGLALGVATEPRRVPLLFSVLVIPISFLGATYYPWTSLNPLPWLKWLVLANPLVYMSEALRLSLTPQTPHMPTPAVYAALIGLTTLLAGWSSRRFRERLLG